MKPLDPSPDKCAQNVRIISGISGDPSPRSSMKLSGRPACGWRARGSRGGGEGAAGGSRAPELAPQPGAHRGARASPPPSPVSRGREGSERRPSGEGRAGNGRRGKEKMREREAARWRGRAAEGRAGRPGNKERARRPGAGSRAAGRPAVSADGRAAFQLRARSWQPGARLPGGGGPAERLHLHKVPARRPGGCGRGGGGERGEERPAAG